MATRKLAARRKNPSLARDIYIVGQSDAFRDTDAPWFMEERISASGRSYSVKVYANEAYTARHMYKSDETKRLVRWAVRLSDGRLVSREGAIRVRAPEAWDRVRPMIAKLRGDRREQALADALWDAISTEEREAMVAAVDIPSYTVGRSLREAQESLYADLIAQGSPLARVDADWERRLRDVYATAAFGGPVGSLQWYAMTWPKWLTYIYSIKGQDAPDAHNLSPVVVVMFNRERTTIIAPWMSSLNTFASIAPIDHAADVVDYFIEMAGGEIDEIETLDFPPVSQMEKRKAIHALWDARLSRMSPQWRPFGRVIIAARDGLRTLLWAARKVALRRSKEPSIAEYEAVMGDSPVSNPSRRRSASRRPAKRAAPRSRPRRR